MQLGLLLTFRCNARCEHCLVSAGPDRSELMDEADVYRYVDQAAAIPHGASSLCLSGGEVFLYYAFLEKIIRYAAPKFKSVSVITNAFWAKNPNAAIKRLAPLQAAGLDTLIVSASPFHSKFVDPARAGFAVAAANELGLRTFVKCTRPNDGRSAEDAVRAMGPGAKHASIQHMSLLPGGRGSHLPSSAFDDRPGIPAGRCPGAVFTISPNGDAYFCCTPGAFIDALKLGNAKTSSIQDLVQEYFLRGVLAFLRSKGPAEFVPAIESAGLARKLRPGYVDVCHLCVSLLADPEILKLAENVAETYQSQILVDLFTKSDKEIAELYGPGPQVTH